MLHSLQRKILLQIKLLSILLTIFIILGCASGGSSGTNPAPAPTPQPPAPPAKAPDLVVSGFTANPPTISSRETVSLSATITNSGNATADSIILRYHRSRNNSINDSGTPIATDDISNLLANSTSDATANVTGHSSGIYYYWACVVPVANESNKANNCATTAIKITGPQPDISVSSFSASPTIISSGGVVNLSATIRNSGNATANSITLRYHRSQSDNTSDSGTPIATGDISRILAGDSNNVTASVTGHSSGTMYYWVCIAVAGETTTDNNCSNNAIAITIGVPDLAVANFTANSSTTTATIDSGGVVNLSAKVRNIGNFIANATTLQYYRSQSDNTNDSANNLATTDSISISSLSVNSSSDATASVTGHGSGIYYYWACVVAVSGESDITNNCSDSVAVTAIVGAAWQQSTNVGWDARDRHSSVVFNNKIWVLGGDDGSNKNDVWSSSNGSDWTRATAAASWAARQGHTSIVFDNKMWVLGGWDRTFHGRYNDVWFSDNGINWTEATDGSRLWDGLVNHTSVVFKNKIWVLGSYDSVSYNGDVWFSSNGSDWSRVTDNAGWDARGRHSSVVFDNKIWVLGGTTIRSNENDVWSSVDGINWTEATDGSARWSARNDHTSTVFDNKIWVLGGSDGSNRYNDVWFSSNGTNWTEVTASTDWSARQNHTSIAFDNNIWVLGGNDGSLKNDIWSSGINNNSFANATSLNAGLNSANKPVSVASHSAILPAGASDFYQISLTAGNWTFATDGTTDTVCEFYNSSQTKLAENDDISVTDDNCSITHPINANGEGDYYILVKGRTNSITGNYTLKITAP